MAADELAEQNPDWAATCAIYGSDEETQVLPLHGRKGSSSGFCTSLRIPICSVSTVAFAYKATEQDHYRYFSIVNGTPSVRVEFEYHCRDNRDDNETDDGDGECDDEDYGMEDESFPSSVRVSWEHYPDEWHYEEKEPFLKWLQERASLTLSNDKTSFEVCAFCEHEALSYWRTFCQDAEYRLVLLPPKMDRPYRKPCGILVHPEKLAADASLEEEPTKSDDPTFSSPEEYARHVLITRWRGVLSKTCPICFETMYCNEGVVLPCRDFFCQDCFKTYLHYKVAEIATFRTNPFLCPLEKCRHAMPIIGFVKKWLSDDDMNRVRGWYKDLKFPPCFSLDRCLSSSCGALGSMRRCSEADPTFVYCDVCDKSWCELCLKRVRTTYQHHQSAECDSGATTLKFCRRYLAATDELKQKCREKYPWIVSYAIHRQSDGEAIRWVLENGQRCPTCQTGVERSEGCFHMKCSNCATHFCYHCGETLFPPYYGTHHCWERDPVG